MASKVVSSAELTADLMFYVRFIKKCFLLAPEVKYSGCRSDLLAVSDRKIIEYEVKTDKADMLRDFDKKLTLGYRRTRRKMAKHELYMEESSPIFVPHYFNFAVSPNILEATLEKCKDFPQYGILVWDPTAKGHMRVIKNARALNDKELNKRVMEKILKRATSDMVKSRVSRHSNSLQIPDEDAEELIIQEELKL